MLTCCELAQLQLHLGPFGATSEEVSIQPIHHHGEMDGWATPKSRAHAQRTCCR